MTEVNIPLLRKGVEFVEAEAAKPRNKSRWNQGDWIVTRLQAARRRNKLSQPQFLGYNGAQSLRKEYETQHERTKECGTLYCFAGYIASLEHEDKDLVRGEYRGSNLHPQSVAQKALGLDMHQAGLLFSGKNTAKDIRKIAESIAGERL